jgi:DNA repair ATPase RecN
MAKKKKTEIQELSEFIRDHMPTKSDLADLREEMVTKDDLKDALGPIQKTLDDHTRRLTTIENDVKTNLDKRLTLEVRVTNIEKNVFGISKGAAHSEPHRPPPQ